MMTNAVGLMVSVCADHKKMLLSTLEFRCKARLEDTVFCRCLMSTTRAMVQAAMMTLLFATVRLTCPSGERNQATTGTSGSIVTALLLDKHAARKHAPPATYSGHRFRSSALTKSM